MLGWQQIDGWFTEGEGAAIQPLARNKVALEFGAWKGRSTACLAEVAAHVVTVDTFEGDNETGKQDTLSAFCENISKSGHDRRVTACKMTFDQFSEGHAGHTFGLVFVDGAHDAVSVERDTRLALKHLQPGGVIAFHDCNYPSVQAGIKAAGITLEGQADSLGWYTDPRDPGKPRVFVSLPHYGDCHPEAVNAWNRPGGEHAEPVIVSRASTSATPHCFNMILAPALDARDRGQITHLAMVHSDLEVSPGWVDVLYQEMRRTGVTAISAVAAIKEPERSRTSTAIGKEDYPWAPERYIRVGQHHDLPRTFTAADVCKPGEVLLINTGCMLIDLMRPYWDEFAFEFRTSIGRRDGRRVAMFAPEDWLMSRWIQQHGDTVAATYAVPTIHYGQAAWKVID